jgi:putative DNA primase/helicase
VLGRDNCTYVPIDSLAAEGSKGQNSRTLINNKLINFSYESKLARIDFNTFKMLASREPLEARYMYGNPFFMENYARTIYSVNSLPTHLESTAGFFRRLLIVPFDVTIEAKDQDKRLAENIIEHEAPGVLNYILKALVSFHGNEDLNIPKELTEIVDDLETETDNVKLWLRDAGYERDAKTVAGKLPTLRDIYFEYKEYCDEAGVQGVLGRTTFIRRLQRFKILTVRGGQNKTVTTRVQLKKGAA